MFTIVNPLPPISFVSSYPNFDIPETIKVCQQFIDTSPNNSPLEKGGQSSASNRDHQPHMHPHFADYYNWLRPIVQDIIFNQWKLEQNIQYVVSNSWVNVHHRGDTTLAHTHGSGVMSIAHYITLPKNCGRLELKDPCEAQRRMYMRQHYNDGWFPIDIKQGDSVMFPGWLEHRTETSEADDPRWVLTTNIVCYNVNPISV